MAAQGFGELRCIKCSETGPIKFNLDDCNTFTCVNCESEFDLDEVRETIDSWRKVLAWINILSQKEDPHGQKPSE